MKGDGGKEEDDIDDATNRNRIIIIPPSTDQCGCSTRYIVTMTRVTSGVVRTRFMAKSERSGHQSIELMKLYCTVLEGELYTEGKKGKQSNAMTGRVRLALSCGGTFMPMIYFNGLVGTSTLSPVPAVLAILHHEV